MRRAHLRRLFETVGLLNVAREARDALLSVRELRANLPYWLRGADDALPVPPLRLVRSATGTSSLTWAFHSGGLAARSIVDALQAHGADIQQCRRILDFGCGFGRVIRHWAPLDAEIHGCDYNRAAIAWCRRRLTFARFEANRLEPPLPYDSGRFDLVYALSVFTHLPGPLFAAWRDELFRIVGPGGFAVVTTHGEAYLEELTEEERQQFRSGHAVVRNDREPGTNRCAVYCSEQYVRRTFADRFAVVAFVPQGARGNPHQDLVLLRKMPRETPGG